MLVKSWISKDDVISDLKQVYEDRQLLILRRIYRSIFLLVFFLILILLPFGYQGLDKNLIQFNHIQV